MGLRRSLLPSLLLAPALLCPAKPCASLKTSLSLWGKVGSRGLHVPWQVRAQAIGQWEEEGARITYSSLVQIKIRSEMTITICSGLIVFPQKLIVLQIGEINCFKSQVD